MIQIFKTTLSKKTQLTSDVWLYAFSLNDPKEISFIPGQYVILIVPQENGEKARRLYSIASSNTSTNGFELLVKLVPGGCASCYFEKMQINDECEFQGPAGMFTLRESPREKIFMVTGTGYAPVRSMLLSKIKDRGSKIYLFMGFPYYKDAFLFEELKLLASRFSPLNFYICLSREQNLDMVPEEDRKYFLTGRVTNGFEQIISTNFNQPQPISRFDFYLCSGRGIVESLKLYLDQKGAPKEQVYFEKF